jgi:hypothetical protein
MLALVAAVALASACGSERETTVLIPTTPSATARTTSTTTTTTTSTGIARLPVGTYTSVNTFNPAGRLPNGLSSCGNVVLNVTSSTATQASGTLTMMCPGNLTVSGTIVGQLGGAVIPITYTGTTNDNGDTCQFQLSGTGTPLGNDIYRLDYTGNSTCQGPFSGSENIRFNNNPSPTPTPTPTPNPPAADMIPLSSAVIRNSPANLASWPITTTIRAVSINSSGIAVDFSKKDGPGRWPDVTPPGWDGPLQYTLGMVMNINGQNYASAPVQFWYGLLYSGGPPSQYAQNWFYDAGRWAPMTYHQPAVGERIGIFACAGNCRNDVTGAGSPVKERTNVVVVTMPSDAGAFFQF